MEHVRTRQANTNRSRKRSPSPVTACFQGGLKWVVQEVFGILWGFFGASMVAGATGTNGQELGMGDVP